MTIEDKNKALLENAKAMSIPLRLMTAAEKTEIGNTTQNSYFKKKYRIALEATTKMMVQDLYIHYPDWSVRDVLTTALKEYNDDLPSALLLEMAQLIVSEWEKKQTSKNEFALA